MTALVGIDCAVQPNDVGLALAELRDGVVIVTKCCKASRRKPPLEIVAGWLKGCGQALIAFDAPLGWSRTLGACLSGHRAGQPMKDQADDMFRRNTDVRIRERLGKRPLEVGADRISRTAVAALGLLESLRIKIGLPIPLAWNRGGVEQIQAIEVYPAATRRVHGAPDGGGNLLGLEHLLDYSRVAKEMLESVDVRDAIVCALARPISCVGQQSLHRT